MTSSLTKELFTPYEEPKRVFHSTMKLFKTTSLDHSSLQEFNLFSDLKNHSEEEVIEAMMEPTRRGDDEEVITDNGLYNPINDNLIKENEIAQIFRIDTNIFFFKTPLCEAFKEFNYLSQIDVDVLTKDIPGFKTYEEYKDDWIYKWNDRIP
ncbi:hypothetical protein Tco_0269148 [Tanacetum coccineum]